MDKSAGYIKLNAWEGASDLYIPLIGENDLWYHSEQSVHHLPKDLRVNALSDASKYDIWHQRLAHCGKWHWKTHINIVMAFHACEEMLSGDAHHACLANYVPRNQVMINDILELLCNRLVQAHHQQLTTQMI